MSLVAYASSDDSDSDETSSSMAPTSKPGGLFARLPAPKRSTSESPGNLGQSKGSTQLSLITVSSAGDENSDTRSQTAKGGLLFDLPKPKKRTEPVKITIPEIKKRDSDSDEDEPRKKKAQLKGPGAGLSSLLPQPKNMVVKEMQRSLVPHTLTKRMDPKKPTKPSLGASQGLTSSSASPSAIKAAAKSAALQLARQIAAEDESDEELTPENYFSLGESSQLIPPIVPSLNPDPVPTSGLLPAPTGMVCGAFQSDAPLDFGANQEGAWGGQQLGAYQQPSAESQGYYNEAYYKDPESDPGLPGPEQPGSSALFDDEAFMRLQGKRNRGKEEVKFLEIKGDDQLSGNQQWMTKSMTEEKQERKSFSKKKGDQPTGQQRRKHQITYLIHQAKERELELKNNWAENKLTRRQTQAKYGF
ncbi:proline-rich protein PRCC [Esox lucius]|uniref:Proline rich mitotic checkpoint control factor n=1 Tax=Esox lucius TaxID=8010 RepID=A0A3P8YC65_ESOLU|nr:proline-rich protein PRCC [Esox lucius]